MTRPLLHSLLEIFTSSWQVLIQAQVPYFHVIRSIFHFVTNDIISEGGQFQEIKKGFINYFQLGSKLELTGYSQDTVPYSLGFNLIIERWVPALEVRIF